MGQEISINITQLTILSGSCGSGGKVWLRLSGLRQCRVIVEVTQHRRGCRAVTRVARAGAGVTQHLRLGTGPRGSWVVSLGPEIGQIQLSDWLMLKLTLTQKR